MVPVARSVRCVQLAALCLSLLLSQGCTPREDAPGQGAAARRARLGFEPCRLPAVGQPAECGWISVYEDREAKRGRRLKLHVAVLPARGRHPQPDPLVLLSGGPGQGAADSWGAQLGAFTRLTQDRDVVLVDQRGTGRSAPLHCDMHVDDLSQVFAEDGVSTLARECRDGLQGDLTRYTTPIAADDLDQVRATLGYERLNLVGVSYGTRLALVYLRRHPARVRTVVLDSVAPQWMALPLWTARDGQQAWDGLVADCAADAGCHQAFGDLAADFDAVLAALEQQPAELRLDHPRTGVPTSFRLGRDAFAGGVRGLLYSAELASLLPHAVARATQGDFAPFVSQVVLMSEGQAEQVSLGLFLSVLCAEDVPRIDEETVSTHCRGSFLGESMVRDLQRACADWPRATLPAGYWDPTASDRPALVLSGALDPVTPPRWGEQALEHLTAGKHIVVPGVAHGTLISGCVPELVERFVRDGGVAGLDPSCVESLQRPPFFIDAAGPEH